MENTLEFSKEVQRSLDVGDDLKVLVNVLLELGFNGGNINLEVDEISVESVACRVKKLVVLFLEHGHELVEVLKDWLDAFQVVLLESLELLDGREEVDEFGDSAAEEVESAENLSGREIELLGLRHVL